MKQAQGDLQGQSHHTLHMLTLGTSAHLPPSTVAALEIRKGQVACLSDGEISRNKAGICPCDVRQWSTALCPGGGTSLL